MTLEVLFAQAAQGRTFLRLLLCGAALALGVQLTGVLHRRSRLLGHGADLLLVLLGALALGEILLQSGAGLRLYGLLGLCIGAAILLMGLWPAVRLLTRAVRRLSRKISPAHQQESQPPVQN